MGFCQRGLTEKKSHLPLKHNNLRGICSDKEELLAGKNQENKKVNIELNVVSTI